MVIRRAHHIHFRIGIAQLFVEIRREMVRLMDFLAADAAKVAATPLQPPIS
jgi:hypothetical protein